MGPEEADRIVEMDDVEVGSRKNLTILPSSWLLGQISVIDDGPFPMHR